MNSSGIKRGLATTAIAALAITGVPAIANAAPLSGAGTIAVLQSADSGIVSVRNDGTNTTVSLVATAGTDVDRIQFKANGVNIGAPVSRTADGDFQVEWTPDPALFNTNVVIATQPVDGAGGNVGTADEDTVLVSAGASALEITPKSSLGVFTQPGATPTSKAAAAGYFGQDGNVSGVAGTKSVAGAGNGGAVTLSAGPNVTDAGPATVDAPANNTAATTTWQGVFEVTDLDTAANAVNQALVKGRADAGSNDAESYSLYQQTIGGISAAAANANPAAGATTNVTVTVTDQNGNPVAGAHVAAVPETGTSTPGTATNGGFTNGRGEVVFAGASAGTHNYYVDATNAAGFTNGFDRQTSVTVGSYVPRATTLNFESKDGNTFDFDENESGDIRVRVLDQQGNPLANEFFFFSTTYTPFVPSTTNQAGTVNGTPRQTDSEGYVSLTVADFAAATRDQLVDGGTGGTVVLNGYVNRDGSAPGQDAADLALAPQTLKIGESDVELDGPASTDRQSGTTQTVTGKLVLADGTALGGRTLTATFAPTGNAALAATQPAGTTRVSGTAANIVTGADGGFSVAITDPSATPQVNEDGGVLTVQGTTTVTANNVTKRGVGTDASDSVTINFKADATASNITLDPNFQANGDAFVETVDGVATPGRPVAFRVRLVNNGGTALAGQQVTLKTSNGFFTPNRGAASTNSPAAGLTADPAPAQGNLYGEWASLGDTITVTTDADGYAEATVAIERDAGFDDDGIVDASITATSGNATNSSPITVRFRTDDSVEALNPGSVEVVPASETGRVGEEVDLDVFAKDQFGNLVEDDVVLTDDTTEAGFEGQVGNGSDAVKSQFTSSDPASVAVAESAVDQTITATWNQASNTYNDRDAVTAGFQPGRLTTANNSVTDTAEIAWTEVNFGDYDITLTSSPEGDVKINSAVTETVTVVDADGNPVAGLRVDFTRQGPGNQAGEDTRVTNAQGQASYTFSSATVGTATVVAVVSENVAGGQSETLTDTVNFVQAQEIIRLNLSANNNGAKPDRLKATTGKAIAEGAVVKFFRIKANGGSVQVGQAVLGADGSVKKNVKDTNGKRFTKYFARVLPTDDTLGDRSNNTRVR